jgi:hypothetical protein
MLVGPLAYVERRVSTSIKMALFESVLVVATDRRMYHPGRALKGPGGVSRGRGT